MMVPSYTDLTMATASNTEQQLETHKLKTHKFKIIKHEHYHQNPRKTNF